MQGNNIFFPQLSKKITEKLFSYKQPQWILSLKVSSCYWFSRKYKRNLHSFWLISFPSFSRDSTLKISYRTFINVWIFQMPVFVIKSEKQIHVFIDKILFTYKQNSTNQLSHLITLAKKCPIIENLNRCLTDIVQESLIHVSWTHQKGQEHGICSFCRFLFNLLNAFTY